MHPPPVVAASKVPSGDNAAPSPPNVFVVQRFTCFHVAVSHTLMLNSAVGLTRLLFGNVMGLSCPIVKSQRPSRLKARLKTPTLCAASDCSFCPECASQKSSVPVCPTFVLSSFPSGLIASGEDEPHTACVTCPAVKENERASSSRSGVGRAPANAIKYTAWPFSSAKLSTCDHEFVSQMTRFSPGNCPPGFAASHRPSGLNATCPKGPLRSVATSFPEAASHTRSCAEPSASQRPSGLNATLWTSLCPAKVCISCTEDTSQILTE